MPKEPLPRYHVEYFLEIHRLRIKFYIMNFCLVNQAAKHEHIGNGGEGSSESGLIVTLFIDSTQPHFELVDLG